jgi:hypothetical protein
MRYKALIKNGMTEVPDEWVRKATDFTPDEIRRLIVVDNIPFGANDTDKLANLFDNDELLDWGMDEFEMGGFNDNPFEQMEQNAEKEAKKEILKNGVKVKIFLIHPEDWINQKNRIVNFLQEQSMRFEIVE